MDFNRRDSGRTESTRLVKNCLLVLFLLLPSTGWPEEINVNLEFRANPVGLKDRVYITLLVDHPEISEISVKAPDFPKGLTVLSGPNMRLYADEKDKNQPKKVRINYTLRADKTGRFAINSFQVQAGKRTVETDPVVFSVGVYRNKELVIPLEAKWIVPAETVAVGEAVPVHLILHNLPEIVLVESFNVTKPRRALLDEAQSLGEIQTLNVGREILYTLPVASYILTPSQSGRVQIASAQVHATGQRADAGAVFINVAPLPSDVATSGAIGKFTVSAWVENRAVATGNEVILSVRLAGVGNLNYLQMPRAEFGEAVLLEKTESAEYAASEEGFSGFRTDTYRLISESAGELTLTVPPFYWLEKDSRNIAQSEEIAIPIEIIEQDPVVEDTAEPFPFAPRNMRQIAKMQSSDVYKSRRNYFWLVPAPLAFVILLVLKRLKIIFVSIVFLLLGAGGQEQQVSVSVQEGLESYFEEDFEAAKSFFVAGLEQLPDNGAILYNLALAEYRLHHIDLSLHYARAAIKRHPMEHDFRLLLRWIHDKAELDGLIHPSARVHPDIFFFCMVLFWSAGFIFLIVQLRRNRGIYIILFVLFLIFSLTSGGLLVYSAVFNNRLTGIVLGEDSELRKIPNYSAQIWLTLHEGQSVEILSRVDSFSLIKTASGLKGWIDSQAIMLDEDVAFQ